MRILVVDDDSKLATTWVGQLTSQGHVVEHANCIHDASVFIDKFRYNLITVDRKLLSEDLTWQIGWCQPQANVLRVYSPLESEYTDLVPSKNKRHMINWFKQNCG